MTRLRAFLCANDVALLLLAMLLVASVLDSCKRSEVYAMEMPILVQDTVRLPFITTGETTK